MVERVTIEKFWREVSVHCWRGARERHVPLVLVVTPAAIAGATSSGALGWTVMPSRPRAASSESQRIRATSSSNADAPRRARGAFRLVLIARPSECGRRPAPGCRPVSTLFPFSLPKQAVWALVHH